MNTKKCHHCNHRAKRLHKVYCEVTYKHIEVCGDCLMDVTMNNKTEKRKMKAQKLMYQLNINQDQPC